MRTATIGRAFRRAVLAWMILLTPATAGAATPPPLGEAAYAGQLAQRFAFLGEHRLAFARVHVSHGSRGRFPFIAVQFDVTRAEAVWLLQHARRTDLYAWGQAVHDELRAHYGGQDFVAALQWKHNAQELIAGTVFPISVTKGSDQGDWPHTWPFVRILGGGDVEIRAFR